MKSKLQDKICLTCKKTFTPESSRSKYCNRKCFFNRNISLNGFKICVNCNKNKELSEFDNKRNHCKDCRVLYKNNNKKTKIDIYMPNLNLIFKNCVKYAKKRNKEWNIEFEDYCRLRTSQCFYCNNLLGKRGVGLDRINNLMGYGIDNVVPCCGRCNIFRSDIYEFDDFVKFSNLIKQIDFEHIQKELINSAKLTKSLEFGEFNLSSGEKSKYYFDASKLMFDSKAINLITQSILKLVNFANITSVGGPATGALPLVSSLLCVLGKNHWPMKGFFVRKETKEYGKKELIEGHLNSNDNVILLEDVTTTGGSLLRAVEEVQKIAKVSQVITVVDRNQGADKLFESKKIPFKAILNINQIL